MPSVNVTAALTQLRDTATEREELRIQNRGANPADVSTDPGLTFGNGITIPAGGEDTLVLEPGQRAFARCGAALATQLVVEG